MAFTPTGPSVPAEGSSIGASIGDFFGSGEKQSAAIKGAESFKAAAKAGKFSVDPEAAKAAIRELERAEDHARNMRMNVTRVARRPSIGGTPYAQQAAGWYEEGGKTALKAVEADQKVLALYQEAIEIAMRNYRRTDSDNAQSFGGKA